MAIVILPSKTDRVVLVASLAAMLPGCGGGQTGQPTGAECGSRRAVAPSARWSDTTVAEAARAFDGDYRLPLTWFAEPSDSAMRTPVGFADELVLTLTYAGTDGMQAPCDGSLFVDAEARVRTTASGFVVDAATREFLSEESPRRADFTLERSSVLSLQAELTETSQGTEVVGAIYPSDSGAPGAWGSFSGVR